MNGIRGATRESSNFALHCSDLYCMECNALSFHGQHSAIVSTVYISEQFLFVWLNCLTLLGLGLIKINIMLANFNNPRPSLTLNN